MRIPEIPSGYKPTNEGWPECIFAITPIVVFRGSTLENYRHCDNPLAKDLWKSAEQILTEKYGRESTEEAFRQVQELEKNTRDERSEILSSIIEGHGGSDLLEHLEYLHQTLEEQIPDKETAYKVSELKFLASGNAHKQYVNLETCQKCPYRIK